MSERWANGIRRSILSALVLAVVPAPAAALTVDLTLRFLTQTGPPGSQVTDFQETVLGHPPDPLPLAGELGSLPDIGTGSTGTRGQVDATGPAVLGLETRAHASGSEQVFRDTEAIARVQDSLTLQCSGGSCPFNTTFQARMRVEGRMAGDVSAGWEGGAAVGAAFFLQFGSAADGFNLSCSLGDPSPPPECGFLPLGGPGINDFFDVDVVLAGSITSFFPLSSAMLTIDGSIGTEVRPGFGCPGPADPCGSGSALLSSDFFGTVTWLGIRALDSQGSEIPGFTAFGTSGVDWAQPVPEPSARMLLGAALATLLWVRRR